MTSMNVYSKEQIDAKIPATTSAAAGDVLTLDSNKNAIWQAPSGGGGVTITELNSNNLISSIMSMDIGDKIIANQIGSGANNGKQITQVEMTYLGLSASNNRTFIVSSGGVLDLSAGRSYPYIVVEFYINPTTYAWGFGYYTTYTGYTKTYETGTGENLTSNNAKLIHYSR